MAQMTPYLWVVERLVKNMGMKTYWIDRKALEQGFLRQGIERAKDREEMKKWKNAFYTLDEVSKNQAIEITELKYGEIARLRKALGRIMGVDAGSLIGTHYRDIIMDIAREALEGKCTPIQT